jgi:hypothetical protein
VNEIKTETPKRKITDEDRSDITQRENMKINGEDEVSGGLGVTDRLDC